MSQNGKGDKRRPTNIKKYETNWERIFGGKAEKPISTPESNNPISGSGLLEKADEWRY